MKEREREDKTLRDLKSCNTRLTIIYDLVCTQWQCS